VSPAVRAGAEGRELRVIDATCPLVTKVHSEAIRFARAGYRIVLIEHAGHKEVEGTLGEAPEETVLVERIAEAEALQFAGADKVAYLTQTTLSVDDTRQIIDVLKRRFPEIVGPAREDICYATSNRQHAVKELAQRAPLVLVVGSTNSSNSQRIVETARTSGAQSFLIEDETAIDPDWLNGVDTVGMTAGASAPERLVQRVCTRLCDGNAAEVEELATSRETVTFAQPHELRHAKPLGDAKPTANAA